MSGVKHTPGPWEVCYTDEIYAGSKHIADAFIYAIGSLEQAVANAHLIAAAPDLLEALENLLTEAEDVFVCMADATGIDRHNLPAPFIKARAAITRARGEQDGGGE